MKKINQMSSILTNLIALQILEFVKKNEGTTVQKIYTSKKYDVKGVKKYLEQAEVSSKLACLRRINVVRTEPDGRFVKYFVNHDVLKSAQEISEMSHIFEPQNIEK